MNLNTISLPTKARPIKDKLYTPTTMVVVCPHSTVVWIIHSLLSWLWIPSAIGIQSSGHAFWLYSLFLKITNCKNLLFSTNFFFQFFFGTKSFCEVFNRKKKENLVEYLLEKKTHKLFLQNFAQFSFWWEK
jgi:hypothetical protein